MFQEREAKPRGTKISFHLAMVALAKFFDLVRRSGGREAGDVRQMAADCIQDILAVEVAQARPSATAEKYP
jgi:hypothetical protein